MPNFQRISLASWNLDAFRWPLTRQGGDQLHGIAGAVASCDPDVACFQGVRSVNDAASLAALLTPLGFAAAVPPGRDAGTNTGGLVSLYKAGGWTLAAEPHFHEFVAHASTGQVIEVGGINRKGVLAISLRNSQRASAVVLNTHLQAQDRLAKTPGVMKHAHRGVRRAQLQEIEAVAAALNPVDTTLVCGDFSTLPEEFPALDFDGWRDLTASFRAAGAPGRRLELDYVFARKGQPLEVAATIRMIESDAVDNTYRDRDGVVATVAAASRQFKVESATLAPLNWQPATGDFFSTPSCDAARTPPPAGPCS